jgi:hypothetical protein
MSRTRHRTACRGPPCDARSAVQIIPMRRNFATNAPRHWRCDAPRAARRIAPPRSSVMRASLPSRQKPWSPIARADTALSRRGIMARARPSRIDPSRRVAAIRSRVDARRDRHRGRAGQRQGPRPLAGSGGQFRGCECHLGTQSRTGGENPRPQTPLKVIYVPQKLVNIVA